jgi:hypothetical protein
MTGFKIDRVHIIQKLTELSQKESGDDKLGDEAVLYDDIRHNPFIRKEITSLFIETSTDNENDQLLNQLPQIVMMLFIDAIYRRDFKTMKALLPRMFEMKNTLHNIYLEVMQSHGIHSSLNNESKQISKALDNCQKDLINLSGYNEQDAWLLVLLALLKPTVDILPMSKDLSRSQRLNYDCNSSSSLDEFNACKQEIEFATQYAHALAEKYKSKNALAELINSEKTFIDMKKKMDFQNKIFNILNVFAWLPLLLTNIKRACYGESFRLFHYVGSDYNKAVAWRMLDAIAPELNKLPAIASPQNNVGGFMGSINRIKSCLEKNIETDWQDTLPLHNFMRSSDKKNPYNQSTFTSNEHRYIREVYALYMARWIINDVTRLQETNLYLEGPFRTPALSDIAEKLKQLKNEQLEKNITTLNARQHVVRSILNAINYPKVTRHDYAAIDNTCVVDIILQLAFATIPMQADYFNTLPHATEGLKGLFLLMNDQQWLTSATTSVVFKSYLQWNESLRAQLDEASSNNTLLTNDELIQTVKSQLMSSCEANKTAFPLIQSCHDDGATVMMSSSL